VRRTAAAVWGVLGLALAAAAEAPTETRYASTVAGGEFRLHFTHPIDSLSADVGPTPVACTLDKERERATCQTPTTLGPGLWPVDVELAVGGDHQRERRIIELRVPSIVAVEPQWVRGGSWLEITLEAPLPNGEPVELSILGPRYERSLEPQLLRPTRLGARLPRDLPDSPTLKLRVRDMESAPFHGLVANAWVRFALGYVAWLAPGLLVGALVALGVALGRPARR
jgi:hypothetical protein